MSVHDKEAGAAAGEKKQATVVAHCTPHGQRGASDVGQGAVASAPFSVVGSAAAPPAMNVLSIAPAGASTSGGDAKSAPMAIESEEKAEAEEKIDDGEDDPGTLYGCCANCHCELRFWMLVPVHQHACFAFNPLAPIELTPDEHKQLRLKDEQLAVRKPRPVREAAGGDYGDEQKVVGFDFFRFALSRDSTRLCRWMVKEFAFCTEGCVIRFGYEHTMSSAKDAVHINHMQLEYRYHRAPIVVTPAPPYEVKARLTDKQYRALTSLRLSRYALVSIRRYPEFIPPTPNEDRAPLENNTAYLELMRTKDLPDNVRRRIRLGHSQLLPEIGLDSDPDSDNEFDAGFEEPSSTPASSLQGLIKKFKPASMSPDLALSLLQKLPAMGASRADAHAAGLSLARIALGPLIEAQNKRDAIDRGQQRVDSKSSAVTRTSSSAPRMPIVTVERGRRPPPSSSSSAAASMLFPQSFTPPSSSASSAPSASSASATHITAASLLLVPPASVFSAASASFSDSAFPSSPPLSSVPPPSVHPPSVSPPAAPSSSALPAWEGETTVLSAPRAPSSAAAAGLFRREEAGGAQRASAPLRPPAPHKPPAPYAAPPPPVRPKAVSAVAAKESAGGKSARVSAAAKK